MRFFEKPLKKDEKGGSASVPASGVDRRSFVGTMGSVVAMAAISPKAVLGSASPDSAPVNSSIPEHIPQTERSVEVFSEEEVRKMIMEENRERNFVLVAGEANRFIQLALGSKKTVTATQADYDRISPLYRGNKDIYYVHIHTLASLFEILDIGPDRKEAIKSGKEKLYSTPPSTQDLQNGILIEKLNIKNKDCWKSRVYGHDGFYEFSGGLSSPLFAELEAYEDSEKIILFEFIDTLNETSKKLLADMGINKSLDKDVVLKALRDTGLTKTESYKPYNKRIKELANTYQEALSKKARIEELGRLIAEPDSHENAWDEYRKILEKEGFNVVFFPYKDQVK